MMALRRRRLPLLVTVGVAVLSTAACGSRAEDREDAHAAAAPASGAVKPAAEGRPRIVVLGDSLTAGLGLASRDAYPTLLQERLKAEGLNFEVVNAGIS